MGADSFLEYGPGADANKVFDALVTEARYEHGSGGYSGSIAEKGSFRIHQREPLTLSEAMTLAQGPLMDDSRYTDKWGDAGAIPLSTLGRDAITRSFTFDLLIDAKDEDWTKNMTKAREEAAKLVMPTECIANIQFTGSTPAVRRVVHPRDGGVLRYIVTDTPRKTFQTGFDTPDEAIKYAENYDPDSWVRSRSCTYEVVGITEPVALVDRLVELLTHHVQVDVSARPAETATVGWLFFGFASC